jgi:hypothetical protein
MKGGAAAPVERCLASSVVRLSRTMEDKCEAEGSPRTGRAGARPYRPNLRVHPRFVCLFLFASIRVHSRLVFSSYPFAVRDNIRSRV